MADAKAIVRRLTDEVFINGNLDAIDELVADNFVDNDPIPGFDAGREGIRAMAGLVQAAFSDKKMILDDFYLDGDIVTENWTMRGRHTGEFMGVAPKGGEVTVRGVELWKVRNDKIVEHWGVVDMLTAFTQMGGFPEF